MDKSESLSVLGEPGTVFQGLNFNYGLISAGAPYNEDYPDALDTLGGSRVLLRYANSRIASVGYRGMFDGGTKSGGVIVMGFPFETIIGQTQRTALMSSIFNYFDLSTSVDEEEKTTVPKDFVLYQNYPNPFNPRTIIEYQIPKNERVTLIVYDILGRAIITLVDKVKEAGIYQSHFSIEQFTLPSGLYFYQIRVGDLVETKKMVLMK